MFARSSSFSGDPTALGAAIEYVGREVMPMLSHIEGCVGLSMMVDRETGDCITTTSWRTVDDMHASAEELAPLRERLGGILDSAAQVQEWEIAAMHRDHATHEGSCCRVTWFRTDHADVDRGVDIYRMAIMPKLEEVDGFCSASLMVNRETSRACSTASYDTWDALDASREQAWAIRDAGVRDAGVDVIDVAEFELALAHLRVPGMDALVKRSRT